MYTVHFYYGFVTSIPLHDVCLMFVHVRHKSQCKVVFTVVPGLLEVAMYVLCMYTPFMYKLCSVAEHFTLVNLNAKRLISLCTLSLVFAQTQRIQFTCVQRIQFTCVQRIQFTCVKRIQFTCVQRIQFTCVWRV